MKTGALRERLRSVLFPGLLAGGLVAAGAVLDVAPATGQSLISRTITVDGDMSDWHAAPSVPDNPGQSSTDCSAGQACELDPIQSTGRDLRRFGFTWDADQLYFYVERYASANNSNTWLFYLDENTNGVMETGEQIFQVDWWGSNRETESYVCTYNAVAPAGDSILGDGRTLPGSASGCSGNLYSGSVKGGSNNGLEMESRVAWSDLGLPGPTNMRFHISSSRGMNLPSHVEDNMVGPGGGGDDGDGGDEGGGGELFPPDMALEVSTGAAALDGFERTVLEVTLTNVYFDPFSAVVVDIPLPGQLTYVSHTVPGGTSFIDTDADGTPDSWQVPDLAPEEVLVLELVVEAQALPVGMSTTTTVALAGWTGSDNVSSNNSDAAAIDILPSPDLVLLKSASVAQAPPGGPVTYTVQVTNPAHAAAYQVDVQTRLDPNLALRLNAFGAGKPFQFIDGAPASGVTLGTPEFSADNGATWGYVPVSGGGGAPPGHDANVTNWRIPLNGVLNSHGGSLEIRYVAVVR